MIAPKLTLNFMSASLDPRITFTRSGATATRTNSSGVIESVAADTARFDYDPVTLAIKGLLIENTTDNIALSSENFSTADWGGGNYTATADVVTAPTGTTVGNSFVEDTATSFHYFQNSAPYTTSAGSYTASVYLKSKSANRRLVIREGISTGAYATFDPDTGTVAGSGGGGTGRITNVGNGWYRCQMTFTASAGVNVASFQMWLVPNTATAIASYTGDGTSGVYIWGAQLELNFVATSYIKTTSAAVTRNADVATITGANFSSWWAASQGGVTANFRPSTVSGTRPIIQYDDGTANEIITLRGNTTNPELYIVDGGTPQAQIDAGTIAANTDYSLTGWWQTNDCRAKLGSGAQVIDNTATIPTVTQARIGSDGTNYLNGHIASISYYDSFTSQIYNRRKNKAIFSLM